MNSQRPYLAECSNVRPPQGGDGYRPAVSLAGPFFDELLNAHGLSLLLDLDCLSST